jgi:hypothetical protein
MRLETYLDAYRDSCERLALMSSNMLFAYPGDRRLRQRDAFRARILRMDAEKDEYIDQLITESIQNIKGMSAILTSKDKRIAELEQMIEGSRLMLDKGD